MKLITYSLVMISVQNIHHNINSEVTKQHKAKY